MNTISHEISSKQEPLATERKLSLSPFPGLDGSAFKPSNSPFNEISLYSSRPKIPHSSAFSPFAPPFTDIKLQRNSPTEQRLHSGNKDPVSCFENSIRKEDSNEDRLPLGIAKPKIPSPQFGETFLEPSYATTNYVPSMPLNQEDIECLRREIDDRVEIKKKPIVIVQQRKKQPILKKSKSNKNHRSKRTSAETSISGGKRREKPFPCNQCRMSFNKAQALGGHMSRRHPGKSNEYNYKKTIRKMREIERVKLHLAKKKFFTTMDYDYDDLLKTVEGKMRARTLMNRTRIKRIKKNLTEEEVNNFLDIKPMDDAQ